MIFLSQVSFSRRPGRPRPGEGKDCVTEQTNPRWRIGRYATTFLKNDDPEIQDLAGKILEF